MCKFIRNWTQSKTVTQNTVYCDSQQWLGIFYLHMVHDEVTKEGKQDIEVSRRSYLKYFSPFHWLVGFFSHLLMPKMTKPLFEFIFLPFFLNSVIKNYRKLRHKHFHYVCFGWTSFMMYFYLWYQLKHNKRMLSFF